MKLPRGLVVSCQARSGSALDDPQIIAALAAVAESNGAIAVRIQGVANIRAVRARVNIPIIGLIKKNYDGFEPYITPTIDDVDAIADAGAVIIAYDATLRSRPGNVEPASIQAAIESRGLVSMADCSDERDAGAACESGAAIVATTLCGYTKESAGAQLPALDLVRFIRRQLVAGSGQQAVCEGGIHTPEQAAAALAAGADAVVVGTAITNVDWQVERFVRSLA